MSATARSSPASARRRASSASRPGMGVDYAIARSLAYAPYADLLWWETSEPNLEEAERFADAIHRQFPGKMLAYNCSPSFNWQKKLSPEKIADFQREIGAHGLQVPVRHAGRLPQPEPVDVQPGARLSRARHGGLFGAAAGGVRGRGRGLHRDAPPARGRRRLFRRGGDGDLGRQVLHHGARRQRPRRSSSTSRARRRRATHDHDDGLVHGHAWATSAPQRD